MKKTKKNLIEMKFGEMELGVRLNEEKVIFERQLVVEAFRLRFARSHGLHLR